MTGRGACWKCARTASPTIRWAAASVVVADLEHEVALAAALAAVEASAAVAVDSAEDMAVAVADMAALLVMLPVVAAAATTPALLP